LEKVLDGALVNLPRSKYLHHVVQPLFGKIGEKWAAGEMKIIHERLATLVIRSQLFDMLKSTILSDAAPRLVVAAPVGQWHETGCLVAALTAAESGWRPMYFGPNLPAEEIAAAAQSTNSKIIALSVGQKIDPSMTVREVRKLKKYCAKQTKIIVGGYGALNIKARLEPIGIKCITNINDFSKELETS
jgi:methanogenic corrinoid protein MtbC1